MDIRIFLIKKESMGNGLNNSRAKRSEETQNFIPVAEYYRTKKKYFK